MLPLMLSRLRVSISKVSRTPFSTIATRLSSAWVTLMSIAFDMELLGVTARRPALAAGRIRSPHLVKSPAHPTVGRGPFISVQRRAGIRPRAAHRRHLLPRPLPPEPRGSGTPRAQYSPSASAPLFDRHASGNLTARGWG